MRGSLARVIRRVAPVALVIALLAPADIRADRGPAPAARGRAGMADVIIQNYVYNPEEVTIGPGAKVRWTNIEGRHSATSNTPVNLWDSELMHNDNFTFEFKYSGTYLYHCTLHFDMTGYVAVVPRATPEQGPVGTLFTITVATEDAPAQLVFDVQMRPSGEPWQNWMMGVTTMSVEFDSTGAAPGAYQFRARLRRVNDNVTPLWSLPASIVVEPAGG